MRLMVAIPAMSWVYTDFLLSLMALDVPEKTTFMVEQNSLVYDARNKLAMAAIEGGYDRVLWLDSDMSFPTDFFSSLNKAMDVSGCHYVSCYYTGRKEPVRPCVYHDVVWRQEDGRIITRADPYYNCPEDMLFECGGTGFGGVLLKTDLLKRVWEKYGPPFQPMMCLGEDLSFCWRVAQLGVQMCCDSRVRIGHIGTRIYREEQQCTE